jgi:serine-type D-Ala-D-Ala carboxypeptidase/endopeptidase
VSIYYICIIQIGVSKHRKYHNINKLYNNMLKKFLILLIVTAGVFNSYKTSSQDLESQVNEIVKPLLDGNKNLGIAVGVFDINAEYPRMFFYGRTNKEENIKPNENTIFEIGSITKTFTTTMLVMLERDGKMKINDLVQVYLPDSVTIHNFTSTEHIKVLHLATHTSGLPRLPGNLMLNPKTDPKDPYKNYTVNDLYYFINNYILEREPGTRYEYSNLGMGLLGHLMTRASGMTYENMLHKYILDSLGMTGTGITLTPEMQKNLAKGYTEKGEPSGLWNFNVLEGAGAIRSNLKDMLTYLAFQMGKTDKLDFKDGLALMQKRRFETGMDNIYIGMGWHISETGSGKQVIWHDGGTGGYRSFIAFIPELQSGVVVLSNQANNVDGVGMQILKYTNR